VKPGTAKTVWTVRIGCAIRPWTVAYGHYAALLVFDLIAMEPNPLVKGIRGVRSWYGITQDGNPVVVRAEAQSKPPAEVTS